MLRIGHRGARVYEPENTLCSFKRALELGVDAVEFDVRKTKDGKIVVMHDEKVDRTTNGKGLIKEFTLKEIKLFDAGKGEKIPTLEETLDLVDKNARMLIELKEVDLEENVLNLIEQRELTENVIIVSFLEEALRRVRELKSEVQIGLIYSKHKNPIKAALELKANYLLPFYRFTHSADVEKAHKNGLKVIVWTINTPEEVEEYEKEGVDGIASDKPDIFK